MTFEGKNKSKYKNNLLLIFNITILVKFINNGLIFLKLKKISPPFNYIFIY